LFQFFQLNFNLQTLNIIIPLGISFYTFKTISYVIDVENEKIDATKNWIVFFNYVSFFPTLLSGPIDKAKLFIPQLETKRRFNAAMAYDGLRQILWGLFKKLVIADNCAIFTSLIFDNSGDYSGSTLLVATFLYTIQVYADFSGYSDMAIGFSRLLGFNVMRNFDFPFFSQNIAEFWRKWHISLTSWLTDYIFTPLSIYFRNYGKIGLICAIVLNFTVVGIWHGANWTYILFGFIHGLLFIPLILKGNMNTRIKKTDTKLVPSINQFINICITFFIIMLSFVIFRAETVTHAWQIFSKIFTSSSFSIPEIRPTYLGILVFIFMLIEWLGRNNQFAIEKKAFKTPRSVRLAFYYIIILTIFLFSRDDKNFIYFQF
jgi:D-alanyl-lipoteichoic acid acyltransferase DltB (MBOAT superfamily)